MEELVVTRSGRALETAVRSGNLPVGALEGGVHEWAIV